MHPILDQCASVHRRRRPPDPVPFDEWQAVLMAARSRNTSNIEPPQPHQFDPNYMYDAAAQIYSTCEGNFPRTLPIYPKTGPGSSNPSSLDALREAALIIGTKLSTNSAVSGPWLFIAKAPTAR